jgi:3-deoxy-D-manno-octulosonate 8-phosphate phosphatase KdsC-like HAD superfamily phosphatase
MVGKDLEDILVMQQNGVAVHPARAHNSAIATCVKALITYLFLTF